MARGATSILHHAKSVRRQPTFSPLDKSRRVFLFAFLSLIVLASTCAIFYIGTHIQAVNLGYNIGQELQRKEALIEENKRLNLEIARLKSPTRIETEAKETLGLELPKTQQVFYLSRLENDTLVRIAGAKTLVEPEAGKPQPAGEKPAVPAAVAAKDEAKPAKPAPTAATPKAPASDAPAVARNEPKHDSSIPAKPATKAPAEPTLAQQDKASKKSPATAEPAVKPAAAKPAATATLAQQDKTAKKSPPAAEPAARPAVAKPATPVLAQQEKALKKSEPPKTDLAPSEAAKPTRPQTVASAKPGVPAKAAAKPVETAKPERTAPGNATVAAKALASKPAEADAPKVVAQKDKDAAPAKRAEGGKNAATKSDLGKAVAPKSSAKEKSPELRVARGEDSDVLVAKIVAREPQREKAAAKLKTGPSLAYQPKDKVPAVMLDPMP